MGHTLVAGNYCGSLSQALLGSWQAPCVERHARLGNTYLRPDNGTIGILNGSESHTRFKLQKMTDSFRLSSSACSRQRRRCNYSNGGVLAVDDDDDDDAKSVPKISSLREASGVRWRRRRACTVKTSAVVAAAAGISGGGGGYGKNEQETLRVLFAAGGTGGHVYPALAIADEIRRLEPDAQILFAGTEERLEWTAVPDAGYEIRPIPAVRVKRPFLSAENLLVPFRLLSAIWECFSLLGKVKPHVVVGTGGYVSVPTCLIAALRRIPLVIQEQNAFAGLANKVIALFATVVFTAFAAAGKYFPKGKAVLAGNPVRSTLLASPSKSQRRDARLFFFPDLPADDKQGAAEDAEVVVVLGGSLGAQALNETMVGTALAMLDSNDRLRIVWQTGAQYHEELAQRVQRHPRLTMLPFVEKMELVYAAADLVVSRAGAITCSELLATSTPSILVPSVNVAEDHQTKNAEAMFDVGAAEIVPEDVLDPAFLATAVNLLLGDKEQLANMRSKASAAATPNAATEIATEILAVAKQASSSKSQFVVA